MEKNGVISTQELEKANGLFLQKQRQYESMENSIIQNNIRIEQLELEKLRLQGDRVNLLKNYQFAINEIIARFKSNVEHWSRTYTILAPIDGSVSLAGKIIENAIVKPDQIVGYIIPDQKGNNIFTCNVSIQNSGKIEQGQKVLIKMDAFPHKEYGMIVSELSSMSTLPEVDNEGFRSYEIQVNLPDTVVSDIGKIIPYKPEMTGQIEIITEDKTITERIFNQFLSLIKQQDI